MVGGPIRGIIASRGINGIDGDREKGSEGKRHLESVENGVEVRFRRIVRRYCWMKSNSSSLYPISRSSMSILST